MTSRARMCQSKASFWSKERAEKSAAKFGQRVYECPVCFCWHCTSLENWRDEFVDADTAKRKLAALEVTLRTEFNAKRKTLNARINELEKANKDLRLLVEHYKHLWQKRDDGEVEP